MWIIIYVNKLFYSFNNDPMVKDMFLKHGSKGK
jgi:hypothetical protein